MSAPTENLILLERSTTFFSGLPASGGSEWCVLADRVSRCGNGLWRFSDDGSRFTVGRAARSGFRNDNGFSPSPISDNGTHGLAGGDIWTWRAHLSAEPWPAKAQDRSALGAGSGVRRLGIPLTRLAFRPWLPSVLLIMDACNRAFPPKSAFRSMSIGHPGMPHSRTTISPAGQHAASPTSAASSTVSPAFSV